MVASADYLDTQIAELTRQKQEKIKILEECQKSNKGLKIAGLTTLGVSAIGVGVNIGEAIKIKGQKSDIADKEKQLDALDSKISSTKILITENNTCGPSDCQGDGNAAAVTLNGTGPVCINNVWAVKSCNTGFDGTLKKCKRKGVEIEYYDACTTDYSYDSCGTENCDANTKTTAEKEKHGYNPVCIRDNWAVQSCDTGYGGTLKKCKRKGVEIEYYDACTKDAAFDTCGSAECDESKQASKLAELKGSGALCVNKEWTVRTCNTGYIGEKQQCTREGISYDFYFKCEPEAGFDSCGSSDCSNKGTSKDAESELHGRPAVCIGGDWAVKSCNANYSGKQEQCKRNGELITYYHQCLEQDGRNTCGSSDCAGDGSAEATILNGSLPICVGDRWHVTVCNEGHSGKITTCTRDGVSHSYYANGCSMVSVPDGVTVTDKGDGTYDIKIDGNTFNVNPQGGIAKIEGQPGNYTYTTHNGNVYNIGTVIINGGTGGNGTVDGNIDINWNFNGIGGLSNINLVQGNDGTLTINGIVDGLILEVTSSNEDVVTVSVNGNNVTITPVGIGTANIKLVVKEKKSGAIKWEQTISVVVSGAGVCTKTPDKCSTDKPQNFEGDLICLDKIWWATDCADGYTPGASLTCDGTTYVRDCYKAESETVAIVSSDGNVVNTAVLVKTKQGRRVQDIVIGKAQATAVVGPCDSIEVPVNDIFSDKSFVFNYTKCDDEENLTTELTNDYHRKYKKKNDSAFIGVVGGQCRVVKCLDNHYLRIGGVGDESFFEMPVGNVQVANQACMEECNYGVIFKYTLNESDGKDGMACMLSPENILDDCKNYCMSHSASRNQRGYDPKKCTLNLWGFVKSVGGVTKCVCNPRYQRNFVGDEKSYGYTDLGIEVILNNE